MDEELEKINHEIDHLSEYIKGLNDACAESIAKITGNAGGRILSYAQEEELNKTIDYYTKILAPLIVDLEELEEARNKLLNP